MNVLIVSPKFHPVIGGGETYVLNSARYLDRAGHKVFVVTEHHPHRKNEDFDFAVYDVPGLSDLQLDIVTATTSMFGLITHLKPDIIHVHGYFGLLVVGLANERKIPIIASIHSTPVWGERIVGGMRSFETELSFARGVLDAARPSLLTAANEVYASAAVRVAEKRTQVITLPYPVDLNYFNHEIDRSMREDFGLTPSDTLLVVPSRIIERKGIREAVLALTMLPDTYYLCLPAAIEPLDPAYWASIQQEPDFASIKHRVLIPKRRLLYDDMPKLYAASDIVVMPSYYEGAPVATVEAMTSGKPFVGADAQGINGFIHHEENGLLVPKKQVKALAAAIKRVAEDEKLAIELARQAQKDVAYLSWDVQFDKLLEAYQAIMAATATSEAVAV